MKRNLYRANPHKKILKYEASLILIGFQFPDLEGKNRQLNIGSNENILNVYMIRMINFIN